MLSFAKLISQLLESLLGSDGINQLGVYQLIDGQTVISEVPSIQVRDTSSLGIIRRIKPESGIECVIDPEPEIMYSPHRNKGVTEVRSYLVSLDQHNPRGTLSEAVRSFIDIQN